MKNITIYHGSPSIVTPVFGEGKTYNDYGQGFYYTENLEIKCRLDFILEAVLK